MNALIKQHLSRAKLRMKKQADKHRSERQFSVGDKVWVKLQPYVQSSLAPRSNQKLAFKFFGPYQILERIGLVAYKLDLPEHTSIHPVFHVSQLKKFMDNEFLATPLPSDIDLLRVPEEILQTKMVLRGMQPIQQALIKWSDWPAELATREDLDIIKHKFPEAPAWGQAAFEEQGNVSNKTPTTGSRVSTRPKRASTRLSRDEWVMCRNFVGPMSECNGY
jgi:hypothetical protein